MYIKFLIVLSVIFFISGCTKKTDPYTCVAYAPTTVASDAEVASLQSYINAHGLSTIVTRHPNGFFYQVTNAGTGITPNVCSDVTVTYRGKLENDTEFDANTSGVTFTLNRLIAGWQLGIPLLKKGGIIKLYLPPSLGYGSSGAGTDIPPNANLIFEIQLVDVVNN